MTKYIEVLQCNNHISSYLCDVLRVEGATKIKMNIMYKILKRIGIMYFTSSKDSSHVTVLAIQMERGIVCRECPKGARFLVRHKKIG